MRHHYRISAEKLTIAQRRMAVFNEVHKQLEDNFGAIADEADNLVNPVTRFVTIYDLLVLLYWKLFYLSLEPFSRVS